jgi:Skp family chaperone for outer membrane proteins
MATNSGLFKEAADMQRQLEGHKQAKAKIEKLIKAIEGELTGARKELAEIEATVCQP